MNAATDAVVDVGGRRLKLSNLTKPMYPTGFTKAQVLDYYAKVAPVLLPHLADRPVTFIRFPDGVDHNGFFTKNAPNGTPAWVRTAAVAGTRGDKDVDFVVIDDLPTLMWAANLAAIELHTPLWRLADREHPDLLVFDLDPGAPATVIDCARIAEEAREVLAAHGLEASAKTSGAKGLHLYAALHGAATVDQAKQIAHAIAVLLEKKHPDRVVSRMAKELRGGKVFIDWSQNHRSKTTIAPYSLRGTPAPSASTPVTWDEIADARYPDDLRFTPDEVVERVERFGDLLAATV